MRVRQTRGVVLALAVAVGSISLAGPAAANCQSGSAGGDSQLPAVVAPTSVAAVSGTAAPTRAAVPSATDVRATGAGTLPFTGGPGAPTVSLGIGLLAIGLTLLAAARYRPRSKPASTIVLVTMAVASLFMALPAGPAAAAAAPCDVLPTQPGDGPPPLVPEVPFAVLLPLGAGALLVGSRWRGSRLPRAHRSKV